MSIESKSNFTQRFKLSAIALSLCLVLASCTSTTDTNTNNTQTTITTTQAFSNLDQSLEQYSALLSKVDANSRFPTLILIARSALANNDLTTAKNTLDILQKESITPLQRDQAQIVEGLLLMKQNKQAEAIFALNKVNELQLPKAVANFYYYAIASAELNLYKSSKNKEHLLKAINHKIKLINFVNEELQTKVALDVVNNLHQLPASELTLLQLSKSSEPVLLGFIDYAIIDSSSSAKLKQQLLTDWLNKYPRHPLTNHANTLIAGNNHMINHDNNLASDNALSFAKARSLKEGDKVAVLLPLTGRFAPSVGEPARLGILAALQDRNSKLKVTFYDTNRMTMAEISSALSQNGTNFILGPILKPEVDALQATKINLPTIVFNKPASPQEQMYYYNLGPDYEGALAAAKIYQDGKRKPIVIAPESTRGQRTIAGFNTTWQQTNLPAPVTCRFNDINDATATLATCPLNNADALYVNATAAEVIKLRPKFPDNTPLYLTDRSYMGLNHSSGEVALSGAKLGDMPWLLTDSELKNELMLNLPKADSQVQRIFAVAYDSINLAFNIEKLIRDRNDVLHGISGELQISKDGLIEMAPMWVTLSVNRQTN